MLVFTVFCIVCTVFFIVCTVVFLLFRLYIFILICYYCNDYCHRVQTQLQYIIIIISRHICQCSVVSIYVDDVHQHQYLFHHHHHISVMELGHLLTRSDLTCPEVSSKVCHDSFCQLGNNVSLPWVIYYEAFCLHVVSSFSCIPVICPYDLQISRPNNTLRTALYLTV